MHVIRVELRRYDIDRCGMALQSLYVKQKPGMVIFKVPGSLNANDRPAAKVIGLLLCFGY